MSKKVTNVDDLDLSKLSKAQLKKVTNKKQRQQLKEAKKLGNQKTASERMADVNDIKNKLLEWQLDEKFDAIKELFEQLQHFVDTGEPVSGKIPFPECPPPPMGRIIAYKFTNVRGQKGTCDLMIRNGQDYFAKHARRDLPQLQPKDLVPPQEPNNDGNFVEELGEVLNENLDK